MDNLQTPATSLTASNRINIPAVCRLPGRGTACVISPGVLLTSTKAIGSRADAAKAKAVFFEGGKREKVTVDLRPDIFFFSAAFPAHVDYCIVACDTDGIRNVTPVRIPLLQTEIPLVREGDTLLVVQHPLYSTLVTQEAKGAGMTLEVKRFEEVLRRRDDLFHLRSNSAYTCFGCPAFNDEGSLVGLQSQLGAEAPPSINPASEHQMTVGAATILSIATIVKHMFANGNLGQVDRPMPSDQLWSSWGIANDAARTILVIQNFSRNKDLHRRASLHLFELANSPDHVRAVASCNGGPVILASMSMHFEDPSIVAEALKALWNLGLIAESSPANQLHTPTPVEPVVQALTKYGSESEEIAQVAVVLLFNAASSAAALNCVLRDEAPPLVYRAMKKFPRVEVLQKFGLGFLRNILKHNNKNAINQSRTSAVPAAPATTMNNASGPQELSDYPSVVGSGGKAQASPLPPPPPPPQQQVGAVLVSEIDRLSRSLVDDGIVEHAAKVMDAFPRSEFLHEHAAGFFEFIGTNPVLRGHPSLQVCVAQLIATILRFPRSHSIAVAGCNALWGLGNDPSIRQAIFSHENGVEALRSAMTVGHSK